MSGPKNVIVAQSGGPSPVINSSLRGVIEACRAQPDVFGTVYGGWHGIEGVLKEELLDLSAQDPQEVALLRTTPAAGSIGTCRYKLKAGQEEDFERVIDVMKAHDVGYFFYIGGNDSMDTANKVAQLAARRGLDLIAVGVPKTIDNDVGDSAFKLIDHTPGYGSVARYWALALQNLNEENAGSSPADPVMVAQAMGRKIGFIPAAARLADPGREWPMLIALTESGVSLAELADRVNDLLRREGRALVVVSEGFDVGDIGARKDSFGHTEFGASEVQAAQAVINYLNGVGLPVPGGARANIPGTDQRHAMIYASTVDLDEAYHVGCKAVEIAASGANGFMATILRAPGSIYTVTFDKVPLEQVANSERSFPANWIASDRLDVTDDFVAYARPLIGDDWPAIPVVDGRQRFARFERIFAPQTLPAYVPQTYRKETVK
ncbi:MAG TPA: diphosphate--fructose-6-phosphate 1-phosphotransferase [Aggregatilinea sp.]|uniref:diphosphate--fructose-6-phosphate 1-phosphotransferase n=1 Tax=Aggregatilinea sp. TaxID=2806333 RepID=UPI002BDC68B2|nr:diphosphate--fructose-6-phosphate 1-phosphotransferase [Aggregatilinea sp.]HML21080.1 diphosphate--fructose-6-phosphate 1-phosphotransferase [Aggregatilinea sp.]